MDLFAGVPVRDYTAAAAGYERLLGTPPSFSPDDTEAVWELADHRYVVVRPKHAGHAMHTLFADNLDARISQIAERIISLRPSHRTRSRVQRIRRSTPRNQPFRSCRAITIRWIWLVPS